MARLQEFYRSTVVDQLMQQFGYKSAMEVPRISKITLNMVNVDFLGHGLLTCSGIWISRGTFR